MPLDRFGSIEDPDRLFLFDRIPGGTVMPVSLCTQLDRDARPSCKASRCANPSAACLDRASKTVTIGLINNMPDSALLATERQFVSLLESASHGIDVKLYLFTMPGIPRSAAVANHIAQNYAGLDRMWDTQLDALIVTGREPSTANLADEPYWDEFTRVVEWARNNTVSTIWSCLAAHATVLHLDQVARRRAERKYTGVFACTRMADHPLMAGVPDELGLPHSRWNGLGEQDLRDGGYTILTRSELAGVDIFVKQSGSLFVFFQGHPEYEANTIALEYRRDVVRFLRGDAASYPSLPHRYFDSETEAALVALQQAVSTSQAEELAAALSSILETVRPEHSWRPAAVRLIGNWLEHIGAQKRLNLLAGVAVASADRMQAAGELPGLDSGAQPAKITSAESRAILTIL
jgi:homoserine O-succinyltransferase/O-acetyltransferase